MVELLSFSLLSSVILCTGINYACLSFTSALEINNCRGTEMIDPRPMKHAQMMACKHSIAGRDCAGTDSRRLLNG